MKLGLLIMTADHAPFFILLNIGLAVEMLAVEMFLKVKILTVI